MKLKSLAVVTLLVLGCSAAFGQVYSFGFLSYNGATQYCDYETFATAKPYAGGVHVLTTCGLPYNGATVGFSGSIPASTGQPVTGAAYLLADQVFDAEDVGFTGVQAIWNTKTKAMAKRNPKWGWSFYYGLYFGYYNYLGNYGYLDTTLGPKANVKSTKTSFGAAHKSIGHNGQNLLK